MIPRNNLTDDISEETEEISIDDLVPKLVQEEKEQSKTAENTEKKITKKIHEELLLLPPLLPFKFGNGLFIQYISNTPGVDDKVGILEVGLYIGLTSLGLYFISVLATYFKNYMDRLQGAQRDFFGKFKKPVNYVHFIVFNIQVLLLIALFLYCCFQYALVSHDDPKSPNYVKNSVFTFSMVVSSMMFFSVLVGIIILVYLKYKTPRHEPDMSTVTSISGEVTPGMQLMPLGLANLMINLYVLQPPESETDSKVFLADLALFEGSLTMLLFSLLSIGKISMLVALRDGYLDYDEKKALRILQIFQYITLSFQLLGFIVMFGHSLVVYSMDWKCPQNLLIACLVVSTVIMTVSAAGAVMFTILYCLNRRRQTQ